MYLSEVELGGVRITHAPDVSTGFILYDASHAAHAVTLWVGVRPFDLAISPVASTAMAHRQMGAHAKAERFCWINPAADADAVADAFDAGDLSAAQHALLRTGGFAYFRARNYAPLPIYAEALAIADVDGDGALSGEERSMNLP